MCRDLFTAQYVYCIKMYYGKYVIWNLLVVSSCFCVVTRAVHKKPLLVKVVYRQQYEEK